MCKSLKCHKSPTPNPLGLSPPRPPDYRSIGQGTWNFRNFKQELLLNGKRPWWARGSHLITWKIQHAMQDDAIRIARIHPAFIPVTGLKRSCDKIFSPLYYRDLGNRASPPFHMNRSKKVRRDLGNRAESSLRLDSCEEALNWDQFQYIFKKLILGCEAWGNKTKGIISRLSDE